MQFTIRYPNGNWTWWRFTRSIPENLIEESHRRPSTDDWGLHYDCWHKGPVVVQRLRLRYQDGEYG